MKLLLLSLLNSISLVFSLTCQRGFTPILQVGDDLVHNWDGSPYCKGGVEACTSKKTCSDLHGDCDEDSDCVNLCFDNEKKDARDYCGTCDHINEGQPHGSLSNGGPYYCNHSKCRCKHTEGDCTSGFGGISHFWRTSSDRCEKGHKCVKWGSRYFADDYQDLLHFSQPILESDKAPDVCISASKANQISYLKPPTSKMYHEYTTSKNKEESDYYSKYALFYYTMVGPFDSSLDRYDPTLEVIAGFCIDGLNGPTGNEAENLAYGNACKNRKSSNGIDARLSSSWREHHPAYNKNEFGKWVNNVCEPKHGQPYQETQQNCKGHGFNGRKTFSECATSCSSVHDTDVFRFGTLNSNKCEFRDKKSGQVLYQCHGFDQDSEQGTFEEGSCLKGHIQWDHEKQSFNDDMVLACDCYCYKRGCHGDKCKHRANVQWSTWKLNLKAQAPTFQPVIGPPVVTDAPLEVDVSFDFKGEITDKNKRLLEAHLKKTLPNVYKDLLIISFNQYGFSFSVKKIHESFITETYLRGCLDEALEFRYYSRFHHVQKRIVNEEVESNTLTPLTIASIVVGGLVMISLLVYQCLPNGKSNEEVVYQKTPNVSADTNESVAMGSKFHRKKMRKMSFISPK